MSDSVGPLRRVTPFFLLTFFLLPHAVGSTELQVSVPRTRAGVMVDGVLSADEWKKAARVTVPGKVNLYFQESGEFVDIAVEYTGAPSGMVDVYLSPRKGDIYDLHASAKLGERTMSEHGFPDWRWWNNQDWTANVSRVDSFDTKTFLPTRVREFQIRLSRFERMTWHVRFELTAQNANNDTQWVMDFPDGTTASSTDGWLRLNLN
jgi:hypothetical protein